MDLLQHLERLLTPRVGASCILMVVRRPRTMGRVRPWERAWRREEVESTMERQKREKRGDSGKQEVREERMDDKRARYPLHPLWGPRRLRTSLLAVLIGGVVVVFSLLLALPSGETLRGSGFSSSLRVSVALVAPAWSSVFAPQYAQNARGERDQKHPTAAGASALVASSGPPTEGSPEGPSPVPIARHAGSAGKTDGLSTVPVSTALAMLAPHLAASLGALGSNVGLTLYDVTHQRAYHYQQRVPFLCGSSIKIPILLAFLAHTEHKGREPNPEEWSLLTTMIENSNNDAASALYEKIGGAAGLAAYLKRIGVRGFTPNREAWGYSQITPLAMVRLLTRLETGTILTAHDRKRAQHLMEHVERDQQWGVGRTAPTGATVAMKNGWLPGPNGLWTVNTSGIVHVDGDTYILSVYTQNQPSFAQGKAMVRHICRVVSARLTRLT